MNVRSFRTDLRHSQQHAKRVHHILRRAFGVCFGRLEIAHPKADRKGIDYIVQLVGPDNRGGRVLVDLKHRSPGCSKHWIDGKPDFALESYSVMPGGVFGTRIEDAQPGWTMDTTKSTDYVLFCFDPADCDRSYLVPFQLLRVAFECNFRHWRGRYRHEVQQSEHEGRQWESECVFVPASVVLAAVQEAGVIASNDRKHRSPGQLPAVAQPGFRAVEWPY